MSANAQKMQRIGSSEYESLARAAAIELYRPRFSRHGVVL
jgi:hypothetical protein